MELTRVIVSWKGWGVGGGRGDEGERFRSFGRPYLMSRYRGWSFTETPYYSKIASEADFLQCDISYDNCKEYPYFNVVAFDHTTIEWVVVARIRSDCQGFSGYALCYKKNCLKSIGVLMKPFSLG